MTTLGTPGGFSVTPLFQAFPKPIRGVEKGEVGQFAVKDAQVVEIGTDGESYESGINALILHKWRIYGDAQLLWLVENQKVLLEWGRRRLDSLRDCWICSGTAWQGPGGRLVARCLDFDRDADRWRRGYCFLDSAGRIDGVKMIVLVDPAHRSGL